MMRNGMVQSLSGAREWWRNGERHRDGGPAHATALHCTPRHQDPNE